MAERAGTRFRALLQSTSWKVTPLNSGVLVLRTKPAIFESPGSASGSSDLTVWPSQRMELLEHSFEQGARPYAQVQPYAQAQLTVSLAESSAVPGRTGRSAAISAVSR